jgi:hypothetical protein
VENARAAGIDIPSVFLSARLGNNGRLRRASSTGYQAPAAQGLHEMKNDKTKPLNARKCCTFSN